MGNVIMKAQQITYGASNVEKALDDLKAPELIELNKRMDAIDAWKANVHEETYTGSELTIENALALPARSLITEINAIQPLHGYDHPWVGGAGKNKFPNNTNPDSNSSGMTVEKLANGYKLTSVSTAQWQNCAWIIADASVYAGKNIFFNALGTYTGGTHLSRVRLEYDDVGGTQVLAAAGDLGTGCTLTIPAGATGVIKAQLYLSYGQDIAVGDTTTFYNIQFEEASSPTTYEPWENKCPISGRTEARVDTENEDSTESAYATIQLGTTVYGADINWDTGVMTVKTTLVDNGTLTWVEQNTAVSNKKRFYAVLSPSAVEASSGALTSKSSQYSLLPQAGTYQADTDGYTITSDNRLYIYADAYSSATAAEFKAAMSGVQTEYTLYRPTTIQLTPEQLTMLKGYNRVTLADGYGEIELKALVLGGDN